MPMLSPQRCAQSALVRHPTSCVKGCALMLLFGWNFTAVAQETPPRTLTETDRPAPVATDATARKDTSSAVSSPPASLTAPSLTGHKRLSEPPTAVRKGSGAPPAQNASSIPSAQSQSQKNPPTTSAPNGSSGQTVSSSERSTPRRRDSRVAPPQKNNAPATPAPVTVAPTPPPPGNARRAVSNEFSDVLRTLDADPDNPSRESLSRESLSRESLSRESLSRDRQGAASSGWLSGLWLVIKLATVVGLIYLTVYLLKLWMTKKPFRLGVAAQSDIKVLETVGLGPNRALHLIAIGEQKLLLASTASAVQLLCEVEAPAAPALAAPPPTANGASPQFAAALRALQEVAGNNEDAAEIAAFSNGRDGRALLREKILKLRESS